MYWQESKDNERYVVPDDVVDVVYSIRCRSLPVDHAYALSQAIQAALPWLAGEERAGVHTIHVAESGNGWMRPDDPNALLHLSRRTKLVLRLPKHRIDDAGRLTGQTLDIQGNPLQIEKASVRPLSELTTLFARYIVTDGADENAFLQDAMKQLDDMGIRPKKMLCGIERVILAPQRSIRTRSLMLAELTLPESIRLQQQGLGAERKLGCGLFIPHKDIKELQQVLD
ncbi:MAG TPA: type I-MYXAN CRISPR-associated protein Cas6/Cmx6 [Candidatus Methylomirabilis sp.]|nr:type I-MYXAN CRISPR-associated protein Cas6/Cmx6 [Candidatus Methylomirabilis sp.]